MAKIDWTAAKRDYLKSETVSLKQLAEQYGVSETAMSDKSRAEGWVELRRKTLSKVEERLVEKLPDEIAEFRIKQAKIGRLMQAKGVEGLQDRRAKTLEEAARVTELGVKIEKEALNISDTPNLKKRIVAEEFFGGGE